MYKMYQLDSENSLREIESNNLFDFDNDDSILDPDFNVLNESVSDKENETDNNESDSALQV